MDVYSSLQGLFVRGSPLTRNELTLLRKYCATDLRSSTFLDTVNKEDLEDFKQRVFEIAMKNESSDKIDLEKVKFQKLALRTLVNAANRSIVLRNLFNQRTLKDLHIILKREACRMEACALLNTIFCNNLAELQSTSEYASLLSSLINLWNDERTNAEERSWISSILSICFEKNGDFLTRCYEILDLRTFTELLHTVSILCDKSDEQKAVNLSICDARFCVELLNKIEQDCNNILTSENVGNGQSLTLMYEMSHLFVLISLLALDRPEYDSVFHPNADVIRYVIWMLEAIIDNEIVYEIRSFKSSDSPDRPTKVVPQRRDAAQNLFVNKLSTVLNFMSVRDVGFLKRNCMEALQNLCCDSPENRLTAGNFDAVGLILNCTRRLNSDCPSQTQRAIAVLRFLCMDCQENQARLAQINNVAPAVIDTKRLLWELGIEAVADPILNTVKLKKVG